MSTVLYADTLLLVNFSMDFLALYIAARFTHAPLRTGRMTAAALLGALFALSAELLELRLTGAFWQIAGFFAWLLCAAGMVRLAFGGRLRAMLLFVGVSVGLGGLMTALYSMLGRLADSLSLPRPDEAPLSSPLLFFAIAAVSGAVSLLWGRSGKKSRRHVDVTVRAFGGEVTLPMLIDSGNLLREPIGGRAVIIVSAAKLAPILPACLSADDPASIADLPPELAGKLRLIPAGGVTGERLLVGIQPDFVRAAGRAIDAVVALDPQDGDYDGCGGIIPDLDLL